MYCLTACVRAKRCFGKPTGGIAVRWRDNRLYKRKNHTLVGFCGWQRVTSGTKFTRKRNAVLRWSCCCCGRWYSRIFVRRPTWSNMSVNVKCRHSQFGQRTVRVSSDGHLRVRYSDDQAAVDVTHRPSSVGTRNTDCLWRWRWQR